MPQDSLLAQTGVILIAQPLLGDVNFDKSVVLLTDHNPKGSVGFILNRPTNFQLNSLLLDFPAIDGNVFYGGPVQDDSLFFIHRKGDLIPGGQPIANGWFWGGDLEPLKELISSGLISASDIRFYLGYSGWGAAQLKEELEQNSWLVQPSQLINPFDANPQSMWQNIMRQQGKEYRLWLNAPSDPNWN
jgi:putative transcriptional regulator